MNQYDILKQCNNEEDLLDNIDKISLITILEEKVLSLDFVVNVILNKKYQKLVEEKDIDIFLITKVQPQLNFMDILNMLKNKC